MNACACPARYRIASQLKTELRVKALERGTFKAAGRQGIITETQQERMDALDAIVDTLMLILAFWFGPATAVKFGPLGRHWLGFMDGATEA